MKKYIFGTTQFAEILASYFVDANLDWGGYIVDCKYINFAPHLQGVSSWEEFSSQEDPENCEILIAIGYHQMNGVREKIYDKIKKAGFHVGTFIHPSACVSRTAFLGEGCIVLENATIQPFVKCGVCNVFWSNVNICHHTVVGNFNFFAASSSILGRVCVGNNCFIGCNSTIKNEIDISDRTLIGAGAYCSKSTSADDVLVPERSVKLAKKSIEMHI